MFLELIYAGVLVCDSAGLVEEASGLRMSQQCPWETSQLPCHVCLGL